MTDLWITIRAGVCGSIVGDALSGYVQGTVRCSNRFDSMRSLAPNPRRNESQLCQ